MANRLRVGEKTGRSSWQHSASVPLPYLIVGIEQSLRRVRARGGRREALEPWPALAHAERIVQYQLSHLPKSWSQERQNLADRLCRLLLLRFAHTRIFADPSALAQCPAILLALSRVWQDEVSNEPGPSMDTLSRVQ